MRLRATASVREGKVKVPERERETPVAEGSSQGCDSQGECAESNATMRNRSIAASSCDLAWNEPGGARPRVTPHENSHNAAKQESQVCAHGGVKRSRVRHNRNAASHPLPLYRGKLRCRAARVCMHKLTEKGIWDKLRKPARARRFPAHTRGSIGRPLGDMGGALGNLRGAVPEPGEPIGSGSPDSWILPPPPGPAKLSWAQAAESLPCGHSQGRDVVS